MKFIIYIRNGCDSPFKAWQIVWAGIEYFKTPNISEGYGRREPVGEGDIATHPRAGL